MPAPVPSPGHRFARLMVVAALSHVVTSTFSALLAVYLDEHHVPAVAVSGFALGGSYLASIVFARWGHHPLALPASLFLIAFGSIGLSAEASMTSGCMTLIVGIGIFRPAMIAQIAQCKPAAMSRENAFSIYTAVINGGYIAGPFIAEICRFRFGWFWLFVLLSGISCTTAILSMLWLSTPKTSAAEAADEESKREPAASGGLLFVALAAVILFYGISQIITSNLALLVEKESSPIHALGGLTLKAGSLAALHGSFALVGSLLISLRRRPWTPALLACVGLLLYTSAFALLAGLRYPVSQSWIVLAFAILSAAETMVGPSILTLGSRLTSGRRGLYWLAAVAGYWGAGLLGSLWERWSHLQFFAVIAFACVVGAAMIASRATAPGWR